jgi:hypothetical protein
MATEIQYGHRKTKWPPNPKIALWSCLLSADIFLIFGLVVLVGEINSIL